MREEWRVVSGEVDDSRQCIEPPVLIGSRNRRRLVPETKEDFSRTSWTDCMHLCQFRLCGWVEWVEVGREEEEGGGRGGGGFHKLSLSIGRGSAVLN